MIANSSGHCRPATKGLVNAAEIVKGVPKHHSGPVVLPFFAEGIREPSKASHSHADTKILALHNRVADTLRIGIARNWDHLYGSDFGGRVPRLAFLRGPINLDELGEASQPVVQRRSDRAAVEQ